MTHKKLNRYQRLWVVLALPWMALFAIYLIAQAASQGLSTIEAPFQFYWYWLGLPVAAYLLVWVVGWKLQRHPWIQFPLGISAAPVLLLLPLVQGEPGIFFGLTGAWAFVVLLITAICAAAVWVIRGD